MSGNFSKCKCPGTICQSIKMHIKPENTAFVKPKALPDSITTLHYRIKRANPSLITMHQLTIDVYDKIFIKIVKFLQHKLSFKQ